MIEIETAIMLGARCRLEGLVLRLPSKQPACITFFLLDAVLLQLGTVTSNSFSEVADGLIFSLEVALDLTMRPLASLQARLDWTDGTSQLIPTVPVARITVDALGAGERNGILLRQRVLDHREAMPDIREMSRSFDSLGDNCEFGIFLSQQGITRPSLFRAGGTPEYRRPIRLAAVALTTGIETYFAGLAEGDDLYFFRFGDEWIAVSRLYGYLSHTGMTDPRLSPDELRAAHGRRVRLAVRTFIELASDPDMILVRKSNGHESESEVRRHVEALQGIGAASLLWVSPVASADEPLGMISLIGSRLIKAQISSFASYQNAGTPDRSAWARIVFETWLVACVVAKRQRVQKIR